MKLEDINETVFQTLSPEVQSQLIRSATSIEMNNGIFIAVVLVLMFGFAFFAIKEI